jgi:hypothetical protein
MAIYDSSKHDGSKLEWLLSVFFVAKIKLPKKDDNYTEVSEYGDGGDQDGDGQGVLLGGQEGLGGRGNGHLHLGGDNGGGDNRDDHFGCGMVVNAGLQNAMDNADLQMLLGQHRIDNAMVGFMHPIGEVHNHDYSFSS